MTSNWRGSSWKEVIPKCNGKVELLSKILFEVVFPFYTFYARLDVFPFCKQTVFLPKGNIRFYEEFCVEDQSSLLLDHVYNLLFFLNMKLLPM